MSDTRTVSPLRQRMIEDMAARKLKTPAHSAQPHFELQAVRRLAEAFAPIQRRPTRLRRFPTAPHRERSEHLQPQSDHDRGAVFVPRHAASPRSGG